MAIPPASALRVLLVALLLLGTVTVLAWNHVLPGGWLLRNLLEDPGSRAERLRKQHHSERLAGFELTSASVPAGAIVFLGSSTIEHWPLESSFPGRPVLDRGIGEERLGELLERLPRGLPARPAAFVLYPASVDFHQDRLPSVDIAAGLARVLEALARLAPDVPVLVLGILPGRDLPEDRILALAAANRALRQTAEGRGEAFVPTSRPSLVTEAGRLRPELTRDGWHLNERGYEQLTQLVRAAPGPVPGMLH